jgi:hypothetical protein
MLTLPHIKIDGAITLSIGRVHCVGLRKFTCFYATPTIIKRHCGNASPLVLNFLMAPEPETPDSEQLPRKPWGTEIVVG